MTIEDALSFEQSGRFCGEQLTGEILKELAAEVRKLHREPICSDCCMDTGLWTWCPYCGGKIEKE